MLCEGRAAFGIGCNEEVVWLVLVGCGFREVVGWESEWHEESIVVCVGWGFLCAVCCCHDGRSGNVRWLIQYRSRNFPLLEMLRFRLEER